MKLVAVVLGALGLVGICLTDYTRVQAENGHRVALLSGEDAAASPLPWVVGSFSVALLLGALIFGLLAWHSSRRVTA